MGVVNAVLEVEDVEAEAAAVAAAAGLLAARGVAPGTGDGARHTEEGAAPAPSVSREQSRRR